VTSFKNVPFAPQNCPKLQRLRWVSRWGRIQQEQVRAIRKEIKVRNFDLIIDGSDESDTEEEEHI
jgi:hypothetical protein